MVCLLITKLSLAIDRQFKHQKAALKAAFLLEATKTNCNRPCANDPLVFFGRNKENDANEVFKRGVFLA